MTLVRLRTRTSIKQKYCFHLNCVDDDNKYAMIILCMSLCQYDMKMSIILTKDCRVLVSRRLPFPQ